MDAMVVASRPSNNSSNNSSSLSLRMQTLDKFRAKLVDCY
jgi:hypothetical protein